MATALSNSGNPENSTTGYDQDDWSENLTATFLGSAVATVLQPPCQLAAKTCSLTKKTLGMFFVTPISALIGALPDRQTPGRTVQRAVVVWNKLPSTGSLTRVVNLLSRSVRYLAGLAPVLFEALSDDIKALNAKVDMNIEAHLRATQEVENDRRISDTERKQKLAKIETRFTATKDRLQKEIIALKEKTETSQGNSETALNQMLQRLGIEDVTPFSATTRLSEENRQLQVKVNAFIEEFSTQHKALEQQISEQTEKLAQQEKTIAELEQQATTTSELEHKASQYDCTQQLFTEARKEQQQTAAELNRLSKEYVDLQQRLHTALLAAENRIQTLEEENGTLSVRAHSENHQLMTLGAELERKKEHITQLSCELRTATARQAKLQTTIQQLIDATKKSKQRYKDDIQDISVKLASARLHDSHQKQEIEDLKEANQNLAADKESTQKLYDGLTRLYESKKTQHESLYNTYQAQVQHTSSVERKSRTLNHEITALKGQVERLQSKLSTSEQRLAEAQLSDSALTSLRGHHSQLNIQTSALAGENTELKAELASVQRRLADKEARQEELTRQHEQTVQQLAQTHQQLVKSNSKLEETELQVQTLKDNLLQARNSLQASAEQSRQLREENLALRNNLQTARQTSASDRTAASEITEQLRLEHTRRIQELEEESASATSQITELEKKASEQEKKAFELETQLQQQKTFSQRQVISLQSAVRTIEAENKRLTTGLEVASKQKTEIETELRLQVGELNEKLLQTEKRKNTQHEATITQLQKELNTSENLRQQQQQEKDAAEERLESVFTAIDKLIVSGNDDKPLSTKERMKLAMLIAFGKNAPDSQVSKMMQGLCQLKRQQV